MTALVDPLVGEAMVSIQSALTGLQLLQANDVDPLENLRFTLQRRVASVYALPVALGRMQLRAPERDGADRIARMLVQDWVAGVELFFARLKADSERIARWMGTMALPSIVSLTAAASDIHGRAGGAIAIEFFGGRRIFYKPRPIEGELLWAELNEAVAAVDHEAAVMSARVLAGGASDPSGYGWMEALERGRCDAGEHWRRSGALLCLAQHTGMGDLHMANVMATGGGPAVLDAECLALSSGPAGDDIAAQMLATGLLPNAHTMSVEALPDVSGLFGAGADAPGVLVPRWSSSLSGGAVVSFDAARLLRQENWYAPSRTPLACLPDLVEGYLRSARALSSVRHDLLAEGGWVDRLGGMHCPRIVLRDTLSYGWLMSRSLFARVIGSGASRRAALRRMLADAPCLFPLQGSAEVLDAEAEALLRLCVPRFHVPSGTCDVAGEEGRVLAHDVVPCTPASLVRQRLEAMLADDFEQEATSALGAILFRAQAIED